MIIPSSINPEMHQATADWLETIVIGLRLCPFAGPAWRQKEVRIATTDSLTSENLLEDLHDECLLLEKDTSIATTLLVIPHYLSEFYDYNQFLTIAESLLEHDRWQGVFQIASFHPNYQFYGTLANDRENWTNRSPYPILHLLRESSLDQAIAGYPGVKNIPQQNIERLNSLSEPEFQKVFNRPSKNTA